MSDEVERSDTYYEVQVDRETLVLLGFGFVALLVAAFLVGRWTAPVGSGEAAAASLAEENASLAEGAERVSAEEVEDVDGEPLFGGSPVSAEGAPPIAAVPQEPLPEREPAAPARGGGPSGETAEAAEASARSPETRAAEPIPAAAAEGWVVQVSAVKSSRDAKALQGRLEAKGWPVRVVREGGYSKVQVGPFAKRSDAESAERRLKREDRLSTWVKRS